MSSTNSTITCVSIGGEEHCNVTLYWTPRVSLVGGIFAMVVPTLFALFSVIYYFFQVEKDGVNVAEEVVQSLTRIANAIFHLSAFARFPVLYCLSMNMIH